MKAPKPKGAGGKVTIAPMTKAEVDKMRTPKSAAPGKAFLATLPTGKKR